jgi:hypothetical protein
MQDRDARLAVGLHGIEPATFEHCALIREWLADLGVQRVTLCVGADRTPGLDAWLQDRRRHGDAVLTAIPDRSARLPIPRPGATLRVDVRPQDFDRRPRHTRALERRLRRAAASRRAVTLDELTTAEPARLRADLPGVLRAP